MNNRIGKKKYFRANTGIKNTGFASPLSTADIWYEKIGVLGSYLFWIFVLFIILGLGACSAGQKNHHDNSEKPKDEKEYHTPVDDLVFFIKKTGGLKKNLVEGVVQNNSEQTTYSNILVMVEFYDEDKALISSEQLKLDESIQPKKMQQLELEVGFPEGTKGYRIKLISADAQPAKLGSPMKSKNSPKN